MRPLGVRNDGFMNSNIGIVEHSLTHTTIDGLLVISPKSVTDLRGTVRELFRSSAYQPALGAGPWQQINLTATHRGAVRGLHGENMSKLVTVASGEAFGVYVDTRAASATAGNVATVRLVPGIQVFVPQGVCNGFQAVADGVTEYLYFFDREWEPGMAGFSVTPLDPALGIDWPIAVDPGNPAQISAKDAAAPFLAEVLS